MPDIYYEVALRFPSEVPGLEEVLRHIFCRFGFNETSLVSSSEKNYSFLKVYFNKKNDADRLVRQLGKMSLNKADVVLRRLGEKDWRDKWKDEIRPFKLTQRFDVVPVWKQDEYQFSGREVIYLDTVLAFGTGLHETTRFMSQIIEKKQGDFKRFLDIGTGTGILSIVAAKCGAEELWAVDIDESSIKTARKNLKKNGLVFDWCSAMDFRSFNIRKKFDFVAANVITDELIVMKKKMISHVKPGKYLALSGISLDNLKRLKEAFSDQPLRCVRVLKGKKWAAILYRRADKE